MKVSIVIPVYNSADTLQDCLDSILNQSFQDWEAVCVNDGSKDDSQAILNEYAEKDSRIKVITKANGGAASARNTALEHITNDEDRWISFVDADDYISPRMYEYIEKAFEELSDIDIDYVRIYPTRTSERYKEANLTAKHPYTADYHVVNGGGTFIQAS